MKDKKSLSLIWQGTCYALPIPAGIAEALNIKEDDAVIVKIDENGGIIIETPKNDVPNFKRPRKLDDKTYLVRVRVIAGYKRKNRYLQKYYGVTIPKGFRDKLQSKEFEYPEILEKNENERYFKLKYKLKNKAYYLSENSEKISQTIMKFFNININLKNYFNSKGYNFPDILIAQFYTALKTKGFVILSGLSGTGKTKIALEFAKLLGDDNYVFLSVHPDWRDSKPLLGYYNPLDGKYYKTSLLELILRAKEDYEKDKEKAMPYFVILDEMNLAHVEYYFSDFLSVLESGRDKDGFTRESIKLHNVDEVERDQRIPKEIKLPPNLYVIGTVNIDETTYMFSPKVLDRAFTIEFHDVDLDNYPSETIDLDSTTLRDLIIEDLRNNGNFLTYSNKKIINTALQEFKSSEYWEILQNLNKALEPYDLHFGYRVVDEIALFFKNAKESQEKGIISFENDDEIFDSALLMKILPKFHGNIKKLEKPLLIVLKVAKDGKLDYSDIGKDKNELFRYLFKDTYTQNQQLDKSEVIINELNKLDNYRFKYTAKKVLRMLRQLYEVGFASFS